MDYTELDKLLATLPGYELVVDSMKTAALIGARIPDSEGNWPNDSEYSATYDYYYAAIMLLPFLQSQPVVTSAGSEGTSISVKPVDWSAIKAFYRGLSPIIAASGSDVLRVIPIPGAPHVRKVSMRDAGGHYGDIDTDVG